MSAKPGYKVQWSAEHVRLLGAMSDADVAKVVGLCVSTVWSERTRRGIPSFRKRRQRIDWTAEMISLLGTATDREVGERLGISGATVADKRRAIGIPSFRGPVAERKKREWSKAELELLGTVSDQEVSRRTGISPPAVRRKRLSLGIPAHEPPRPELEWSEGALEELDSLPASELAAKLGVSTHAVHHRRMLLNVRRRRTAELANRAWGVVRALEEGDGSGALRLARELASCLEEQDR